MVVTIALFISIVVSSRTQVLIAAGMEPGKLNITIRNPDFRRLDLVGDDSVASAQRVVAPKLRSFIQSFARQSTSRNTKYCGSRANDAAPVLVS